MVKMLSVVIPYYDGLAYIKESVNSVINQGFNDVEVIIVDDCDSKRSGNLLEELFNHDTRVKILHRNFNGGTLRARRDGVLASGGKYVMLMDQDDSLAPGSLKFLLAEMEKQPVDILHFGVKVIAETPDAEVARTGMQAFLTPPIRILTGNDILKYQFADEGGYDWQVHHKVYKGDFARTSWASAADDFLVQADDLYMSFILDVKASTYKSVPNECYIYHLGRGDTFGCLYTFEQFQKICKFDAKAYNMLCDYVASDPAGIERDNFEEPLLGAQRKLVSHTMNELVDNLEASDREKGIDFVLRYWKSESVAPELMRLARDDAYSRLKNGYPIDNSASCISWYKFANKIMDGAAAGNFLAYKADAEIHILSAILNVHPTVAQIEAAVDLLGSGAVAEGLMCLSRDDAYSRLKSGKAIDAESDCVVWYKHALSLVGDELSERLFEYKKDAEEHMLAVLFGKNPDNAHIDAAAGLLCVEPVAFELMRLARDGAYAALKSADSVDETADCFRYFAQGEALAAKLGSAPSAEFLSISDTARGHLYDLERAAGFASSASADAPTLSMRSVYEDEDVRIFVTTHKNVDLFHSNVLQPVQVGGRSPRRRLLWAYQDDAGYSISDQNAMYCELTTQYWAWKNVDAKYYGFCHYRRYFDFSDVEHEENAYGEVMDRSIDWDSQKRYCLDDDSIRSAVEGCDIVTTGIKDLREFPEKYESPYDHYARAPYLKIADLDRVIAILKEMHPDYASDADAYLAGHLTCFCNMYVMRKELFFRYCEWMFPILERFVDGWDTSLLSHETLRTPGHLSERLFNIWLTHEKRVNPALKYKQVQCVHFEKPDHAPEPRLACADGHGMPVVPVVFAADNNYVPMVTTTAYSMLKNASPDCFYDVVILEKDFTAYNKRLMSEFFARFTNASVRFVNVAGMVSAYNLQTSNEHISVETYYRFLIQKVLPGYDKVLYLDSDLIVEGDVAELYAIEMGDNLIAAARDIDYLGNLNMNDGERLKYTNEVLGLANPYDYFQAGVLVLNTAEMRKLYPFQKWLEIAAEPKYIYDDQDILNEHCEGRVVYLDNAWNVMNDCGGRIKKVFTFAPADVYDKYMVAYAAPRIIHYAGFEKPWKPGPCDLGEMYWMYARETPFYERFIAMKYPNRGEVDEQVGHSVGDLEYRLTTPERAISEDSPLRKVFDVALPQGSYRREAAKAVVRRLRGRN